jgi:hypothetical protein
MLSAVWVQAIRSRPVISFDGGFAGGCAGGSVDGGVVRPPHAASAVMAYTRNTVATRFTS